MNDQEYYYARLFGAVKNPKEFYEKFTKTETKLNNFRRDNEFLKKKLSQCLKDLKKSQEELKEARKALRSIAQNDLIVPLGRGKREIQSGDSENDLEFHQEVPGPYQGVPGPYQVVSEALQGVSGPYQGVPGPFQNPSAPPPPYSEIIWQ